MKLPKEIKLTLHAQLRLQERNFTNYKYNTKNIMKSSCKWYGKDDLIHDCALYRHCCYVTRKSNQIGYITDGEIEVVYNKGTKIAITILNVKDKFKPITQYIKPELLKQIENRKEKIKMNQSKFTFKGICADCGKEDELNYNNICATCMRRQVNAKHRGKEYVRYLDLSEKEKQKVDKAIEGQLKRKKVQTAISEPLPEIVAPTAENYYQSKAEQKPVETHHVPMAVDIPQSQLNFINIIKECGCVIPDEIIKNLLDILIATDKLKDTFTDIAKDANKQAMGQLEETLDMAEKKLQYNWEVNGFQEEDDIKFKDFIMWRRMLKSSIFFWKKLSTSLVDLQKAWDSYMNTTSSVTTPEPIPTVTPAPVTTATITAPTLQLKKYQITTESISTILNTKRPFTRVFYAVSEEKAYESFLKWMADRQLHENKTKTVITELTSEGGATYDKA